VKLARPTILLALVLFLIGCSEENKKIVGKWKSDGSDVTWEFYENGTLSTDGKPGRYTFGDNERVKIQTQTATFMYQLELQGDHMTWRAPDGTRQELTRER